MDTNPQSPPPVGEPGPAAEPSAPAGESTRPVLGAVSDAVASLGKALTEPTWALGDAELGLVLEQLDVLRRDTERLLVETVGDATGRGTPDAENCSSATDYVVAHSPSLDGPAAHRVVRVAAACRPAKHAPRAEASSPRSACATTCSARPAGSSPTITNIRPCHRRCPGSIRARRIGRA